MSWPLPLFLTKNLHATIISLTYLEFSRFIQFKQLTLSSMMGKEMSMNASFTVEICWRKKTNQCHRSILHSLACLKDTHSMLRKSIRTKMKRLLPGPHLELSTFKDTLKFSSWQLIYLIVNACCKLMLELVLEMLFCAFFFNLLL